MAIYKNKDELLNTDWQKKIDEAAALGNWQAAAYPSYESYVRAYLRCLSEQ